MDKENRQNAEKKLEKDKKSFWKVDKEMIPYKIHYFLSIGAVGALFPYFPSIGISRLNLGAANLAVIFMVQQFLIIVFKPIIGYSVDYFNNLKTMIVTLTTINVVVSYLLLSIPKVSENSFIANYSESRMSTHAIFCKFCELSSELKTMVDYIPATSDEFEDEKFEGETYNVASETFAGYCPKSSNSSLTFNIKLEIKIHTIYFTKYESEQTGNFDVNKSSIIFIRMYHHWISPELDIVCPDVKNYSKFETMNFTLNNIVNYCFKYPQDKILSNNITFKKYPKLSNNIVCNSSGVSETNEVYRFDSFKTYQFWLYALFLLISCTSTSAMFVLSDIACYETIQTTGSEYGKQRAWGAIGWGLFAPFSGFLNDYTDDYWAAVFLLSLLCAFQIWNLTKMNLSKPHQSKSILTDMKTLLNSVEFIAFLVSVFINGIGIGIVIFFLAWFITDIGGSRLLIGLANSVQCFLGEMPLMIFSGWLIKKVGHFNVVSMALMAHAIRFLAYSSLKDPWMILPIECLDGITFGAFYAALTSYGKMTAKPGTEATTQSLCSACRDLGAGMGCVIGGACFDYFGGYTTFFYAGLCFAGAAALNITSTILLQLKKHYSTEITNDISGPPRY